LVPGRLPEPEESWFLSMIDIRTTPIVMLCSSLYGSSQMLKLMVPCIKMTHCSNKTRRINQVFFAISFEGFSL